MEIRCSIHLSGLYKEILLLFSIHFLSLRLSGTSQGDQIARTGQFRALETPASGWVPLTQVCAVKHTPRPSAGPWGERSCPFGNTKLVLYVSGATRGCFATSLGAACLKKNPVEWKACKKLGMPDHILSHHLVLDLASSFSFFKHLFIYLFILAALGLSCSMQNL